MKTDSTTYVTDSLAVNPALTGEVSVPAFQYLPPTYWDKDILFSTDSPDIQTEAVTTVVQLEKHEGLEPLFSIEKLDGVFALLLICFLLLTHIYRGGLVFFKETLPLVFTTRQKVNQLSETTISEFWYNFLLIVQYILLFSIVIFIHFLDRNTPYVPPHSFLTILLFSLVLAVFLGAKLLFYKLVGYIFDIQVAIKVWNRSYIILLEIVGLVAFIPVLFLVYSNYFHGILMVFFLLLFLLSRLIIIYRIGGFFLQENVNFLFLIAYLCSVEIIPYILLYEGLAYLFKIDIFSLLWL